MAPADKTFVAVDIGNSRIKLGQFEALSAEPLMQPLRALTLAPSWSDAEIQDWLPGSPADYAWNIASVNRPAAASLVDWLTRRGATRVKSLSRDDMPIKIDVSHPETIGLDRLAHGVAANCLRQPDEPAIVVDHGSALVVDLVNEQGVFRGGAILPGVAMSARALHEFTDGLPLVEVRDQPVVLERSTRGAMQFGLYWGAVGAVRELIRRLLPEIDAPQVFLTGGGAPALAAILGAGSPRPPQYVPHLTLSGVATAAARLAAKGQP